MIVVTDIEGATHNLNGETWAVLGGGELAVAKSGANEPDWIALFAAGKWLSVRRTKATPAVAATERTIKYATRCDTLTEVWAFIMSHLEELGDTPTISIKPYWTNLDTEDERVGFDVGVSSMSITD